MDQLRILIVDDEPELRRSLILTLKSILPQVALRIFEADDGLQAVESVQRLGVDLVIMDVRMPRLNGLEALQKIRAIDPKIFVVIVTAHSHIQDAILAIKSGAYDYIEKPIDTTRLLHVLTKAIETRQMVSELALSRPLMDDDVESELIGSSGKMSEVFHLIHRLSQVETTVLIRGENGTGKELVARAIHFNSPRKHGELIVVNCASIPEGLIESELFGHERGAFTGAVQRRIGKFQLANKGTLFLDEVAELKPEMQVKLLRALQEHLFTPVGSNRELRTSARIIAATNRNLEKMIEDGDLREDFFYRLNVMPIFLPPLRDRVEDIEILARHFVAKLAPASNSKIQGIAPEAMAVLREHSWPGNIRELENVIERALVLETTDLIQIESLPEAVRIGAGQKTLFDFRQNYQGPLDFDRFKEATEREFIVQALKANRGRINQTVAHANIPKNTLLRKIRKYMINVNDYLHR